MATTVDTTGTSSLFARAAALRLSAGRRWSDGGDVATGGSATDRADYQGDDGDRGHAEAAAGRRWGRRARGRGPERRVAHRALIARTVLPLRARHRVGRRGRRGGPLAPRGGLDELRLDELPDRGGPDLQVDVGVGLDRHVPRARDLRLLVKALE